ncbi:MAB_1171c family putative transporter [Streptomyces sp. NPDC007084]|uniref:MAB_1171c family putative transporter n=1 Tax=Streptomyces sp. NPDC007084 TaxID=3154313 RepID=UPI003452ACE6
MESSDYYIPAIALWACLAIRLPGLLRDWRDPLVRSVGLVVALGGAGFVFAAPPTIAAVNTVSGVPNASSLLVYVIISAFSVSCLLLIVHWRGGPPAYVRRVSRRWRIAYLLVIAALVTLFALGDAPEERRTDFDTHYASQPFIAEMIVLYLVAHITAAVVTTALCWRWSLQVHGWLRAGLVVLCAGWLLNLSFSSLKLAAVSARWAGHDWDTLSTTFSPLVSAVAAPCATVGFLLPLVGPRAAASVRAVAACHRLGTLWRELGGAACGTELAGPVSWYASPHVRLTRREAGIQDGLSLIRPYLDDAVRTRAVAAAEAAGALAGEAALAGDAAMVHSAVHARREGRPGAASVAPDASVAALRADLPGLSRALRARPARAVRPRPAPPSPATARDGERTRT